MPPRMTHRQAEAREAFEPIFASAGALAFMHAYAESAAPPALSQAFAERKPACPLAPLYHRRRDHPGSHKPPKHVRPVLASTGLRRNTLSAAKPLARHTVSV